MSLTADSMHPCLTPFVIANVSDISPSMADVDYHSGMQTLYHGCALFGASIFPQHLLQSGIPTVSNVFMKSTMVMRFESLLGTIRAKTLPASERSYIPQ